MLVQFGPVASILVLHAVAAAASAQACPPIAFGKTYATAEQAATTALRNLFHGKERYEFGGYVIERNGVFRASEPATQRSRTEVNYCIVLPRDTNLAGLYHTHVGNPEFSARDRRNSERVGVPSYIGTLRDGTLHVYDPEIATARVIGRASEGARAASMAPDGRTWPDKIGAAAQRAWAVARETWERVDN